MKNKKQIKPKTSNYSTKKWIISLSIFGIIGVGAAVVLPLVMCNKQKPSTSVYTAEPVNKFLDTNIIETPLVTKLNNSQVISNDFVSYEVENSYNKFINTYKDDNGNWQVRWNSLESHPTTNTTAVIDAYIDNVKMTTASLVLEKGEAPSDHTYSARLSESILRKTGDTSVITTFIDGEKLLNVAYQIPAESKTYINKEYTGEEWKIKFANYPTRPLTVNIRVMSEGNLPHELTNVDITLLPYQPEQVINNTTGGTPHSINLYSDDGGGGVPNLIVDNAINLEDAAKPNLWPIFMIEGEITHPIVIPSDFACWIFGKANSSISVSTNTPSTNAYGIVIGNVKSNTVLTQSAPISIVDTDISISATGSNSESCDIYFNNSAYENVTVDNNVLFALGCGSRNLYCQFGGDIYGIFMVSNNVCMSKSSQHTCICFDMESVFFNVVNFINNVISAICTNDYAANGIYLLNSAASATINFEGNYVYSSCAFAAYGFYYSGNDSINCDINIVNNIIFASSQNEPVDICFDVNVGGSLIVSYNNLSNVGGDSTNISVETRDLSGGGSIFNNTFSISSDNNIVGALETSLPPVVPLLDDRNVLYWETPYGCYPTSSGENADYFKNGDPVGNGDEVDFQAPIDVSWYDIQGAEFNFSIFYTNDIGTATITPKNKLITKLQEDIALTTNAVSKIVLQSLLSSLISH